MSAVSEDQCLIQIRNDEQFGAVNNPGLNAELGHNRGKKKSENKAAISYTYDDDGSSGVKKDGSRNAKSSQEISDSDSEEEEIDLGRWYCGT